MAQEAENKENFEGMDETELKRLARKRGIDHADNLSRDEIIGMLRAKESSTA